MPLNLLDYRCRYLLKHDTETVSCVVLLRPSGSASDIFEDREVRFPHRLVKIFEWDAEEMIDSGITCLLPFVPLMKNGPELTDEADRLIYAGNFSRSRKADMLTTMAILSGLKGNDLPARLIARRRDIMIESAAYDIIKNEGIVEGIKIGEKKGLKEGIQIGENKARLKSLSSASKILLEIKFGVSSLKMYERIKGIQNPDRLDALLEIIRLAETPEDVLNFLDEE